MNILCKKGHWVNLKRKRCKQCKSKMSLWGIPFGIFSLLCRGPLVQCPSPRCGKAFPITYAACPYCTTDYSLSMLIDSVFMPIGQKARLFLEDKSPETRGLFQQGFALVSFCLLALLFFLQPKNGSDNVAGRVAVCIIFLASLFMMARCLVPTRYFDVFVRRTSGLVKISIVFNYFSALILLVGFVNTWWEQCVAFTLLIVITYGGMYVFCHFFWDSSYYFASIFLSKKRNTPFDPSARQGRNGFMDDQ